jgi:hypothetical protein
MNMEQDSMPVALDSNAGLGILLEDELPRETTGAPCVCGGYADEVETTNDEEGRYGCGRTGCCLGAFKCRMCGKRLLALFPAPEME